MRSHDPQRQEDGFGWIHPRASEYADELIAEFAQASDDLGLRRWLLDLIGEAAAPAALPLFAAQLDSPDESLRDLAVDGLAKLDTHEARTLLWQARANGTIS